MSDFDNLCMGCMRDKGEEKQCPHCGFFEESPQIAPYLPLKTVVGERYRIGRMLDCNGDGATYIGWDINQKMPVYIREFLPDAIAQRDTEVSLELKPMAGCEAIYADCIQSFLELWRKLIRLRGLSALIPAYDIAEDYGTAYAVYEYEKSVTLRDYLLNTKQGYISWEQAMSLFMPVLSTLGNLHAAGILHRGLSPVTLVIGKDNKMRITGFSIGQVRTAGGDLSAQLFSGYAAFEQYGFECQQGAWTDIYSFAAVLYRSLIGSTPPGAKDRAINDKMMIPGRFAETIPAYVINAMVNALQILPEDRTKNVEQLRDEISASPNVTTNAQIDFSSPVANSREAVEDEKSQREKKQRRRTALKAAFFSGIICIAFLIVMAFTVFREQLSDIFDGETEQTTETQAVSAPIIIDIPNFEGKSYESICATSNFTARYNFIVQKQKSDTVQEGVVISQSIKAYTKAELLPDKKIDITLTVSEGAQKLIMPDVLGKTYDEAVKLIEEAGFSKDNITVYNMNNDGTKLNNSVYSASPEAGKQCDKSQKIILQVWSEYRATSAIR